MRAVSLAVPAAMLMPRVPSPVIDDSVTVRVLPEPVTLTLPALADPVELTVMLPADSVDELKFASL